MKIDIICNGKRATYNDKSLYLRWFRFKRFIKSLFRKSELDMAIDKGVDEICELEDKRLLEEVKNANAIRKA